MHVISIIIFLMTSSIAYGVLAGGRPNAISGGRNAFAGVVNPANAVWVEDRVDVGTFSVLQNTSLDNRDDNPFLPPGKTDLTYRVKYLFSADLAVHKRVKEMMSFSLASYTTPGGLKLRTNVPFPGSGVTPLYVFTKIQVVSFVFALKLNPCHSIGFSLDYFYLTHERRGFQLLDNPLRSVSPGHVTNNGRDHSGGLGMSLGWRWNITPTLSFGAAWIRKSHVGQFRKYRGFEPHHAQNFIPQTAGAGFTYLFTPRFAGRLEVIWTDFGNLPGANNNIVDGKLNVHKRGSRKSPGPGLQDATFINLGFGGRVNEMLSLGVGLSHRIKLHKGSNILSHTYTLTTIYDLLAFGAEISCGKHELFFTLSFGLKNRVSGDMPEELGGGRVTGETRLTAFSAAWGYKY